MLPGIGLIGMLLASGVVVNPVTLVNANATKSNLTATTATATLNFNTSRTVTDQDGATLETWLLAGYSSANYQIRATVSSGVTPTGDSTGVWLALSSGRSWSVSETSAVAGVTSSSLYIEIRDAAAPNTVRASATFGLYADSARNEASTALSASGYTSTYIPATAELMVNATGAPVNLHFDATVDHASTGSLGGTSQNAKIQRKLGVGGAWTDVGVTQNTGTVESPDGGGGFEYTGGSWYYDLTESPAAGTYYYRVVVNKGTGAKTAFCDGTFSLNYT